MYTEVKQLSDIVECVNQNKIQHIGETAAKLLSGLMVVIKKK